MRIAEEFTKKRQEIIYPVADPQKVAEIEDMPGKANRVTAMKEYKESIAAARHKYHEDQYRLDYEFKLALFKEYSVVNHPKRERIFSMAWERGHSSGYNDVEIEFEELVELIK